MLPFAAMPKVAVADCPVNKLSVIFKTVSNGDT
jgi:hypothetical protein